MGITVFGSPAPVLSDTTPNPLSATGAAGSSSLQSRSDHVHTWADTGWLIPSLQNGWLVYDATYGHAAMYRKIDNIVFMRGLLKNGSGVIFNLPAGFRPSLRMLFSNDNSAGHGRFDVQAAGDVVFISGTNGYFSIACSFVADA